MCTYSPPTPTHTHAHTYTPTPTQTHILSYRDSSYTPTLWGLQHKRTKHSSHLLMCYTHFETRNFYIYSFSWGSTNSINTMVVRHLILKFPIFFRMLHILCLGNSQYLFMECTRSGKMCGYKFFCRHLYSYDNYLA